MIERDKDRIRIAHPDGAWEAEHEAERFGGPALIRVNGTPVLEACRFYVDDITDESAVVKKNRAFRKAGTATVVSRGYLPFGREAGFIQTCRYAANHVRVTFDLHWPRGAVIRRHLGVGGLFLPGKWKRCFCVPPALHIADGAKPAWQEIPEPGEAPLMVGHWHRPPLALVFERDDGVAVEIGTGSDLWRWEYALGVGPESGSYKAMLEQDGLRLIREPLMCCAEFAPAPREYRFTWYAAWRVPPAPSPPDFPPGTDVKFGERQEGASDSEAGATAPDNADGPSFALDPRRMPCPSAWRRAGSPMGYVRDERTPCPCWQSAGVQKTARRVIRQLAARPSGWLTVRGLAPGVCWDPAHLDRKNRNGMGHWDVNAILDFAVWTRQQLGPEWRVRTDSPELNELPSLAGLFSRNGFEMEV